jgi:hypothetical protein
MVYSDVGRGERRVLERCRHGARWCLNIRGRAGSSFGVHHLHGTALVILRMGAW